MHFAMQKLITRKGKNEKELREKKITLYLIGANKVAA
jgi:hypothetical protein